MSKKNIEEASQKIALLKEKAKSAKSEKVKKSIEARIATIQKETKEQEQITGKELAQSVIKSRKKFMTMSDEDFNKIIKTLSGTPEYSFLKGMTRDEIVRDLQRKAKPVGWRFKGKSTKVPTKKQRGKAGTYYENRENRSDVNRSRQLEQGGSVGTGGTSDSAMDMNAPTIGGTMASSMAKGGNVDPMIFSNLTELWFAVHNSETSKYKSIAEKLDNQKVSFTIQNKVSEDASKARSRKAIDTFEVKERIKNILFNKLQKGGNLEALYYLDEYEESNDPKIAQEAKNIQDWIYSQKWSDDDGTLAKKRDAKIKLFEKQFGLKVKSGSMAKGGNIKSFSDGFKWEIVSKQEAKKLLEEDKEVYGLNFEEETEGLIEEPADLELYDDFGVEVGFMQKGGNVKDLKIGDKIKYYDDRMERWSTAEVEEKLQNGNWGVRDKFSRFSITPNLQWEKLEDEAPNKKKRFGMFQDGGIVPKAGWCYVIFKTSETVSNPAIAPSTVAYDNLQDAEKFAESIKSSGGVAMVTDLGNPVNQSKKTTSLNKEEKWLQNVVVPTLRQLLEKLYNAKNDIAKNFYKNRYDVQLKDFAKVSELSEDEIRRKVMEMEHGGSIKHYDNEDDFKFNH